MAQYRLLHSSRFLLVGDGDDGSGQLAWRAGNLAGSRLLGGLQHCQRFLPRRQIDPPPRRKKLSTTIGANSYAYLHNMVNAGKAESVGEAVDKAVEMARRLDSRATLERQTANYFKGLPPRPPQKSSDLEDALSAASQEMDCDHL